MERVLRTIRDQLRPCVHRDRPFNGRHGSKMGYVHNFGRYLYRFSDELFGDLYVDVSAHLHEFRFVLRSSLHG